MGKPVYTQTQMTAEIAAVQDNTWDRAAADMRERADCAVLALKNPRSETCDWDRGYNAGFAAAIVAADKAIRALPTREG